MKFIDIIFCDDIRQEVNNKLSKIFFLFMFDIISPKTKLSQHKTGREMKRVAQRRKQTRCRDSTCCQAYRKTRPTSDHCRPGTQGGK